VESRPFRFYVHNPWPRWLGVSLLALSLAVLVLYFAAPDVPKKEAIPILLLLVALVYASHRASLAWIEFSADGSRISSVPSWYARKAWGERAKTIEIPRGSELVFSLNTAYGFFNGHSLLLHSPERHEQLLCKIDYAFSYRRSATLVREAGHRWGLPVRLVVRNLTPQGVEEREWTLARERLGRRFLLVGIAFSCFPFTGILVRLLTSDPLELVIIGTAICLLGSLALWLWSNRQTKEDFRVSSAGVVAWWAFRFTLFYTVVVIVTDALLKR
jgi:hypothetical protein